MGKLELHFSCIHRSELVRSVFCPDSTSRPRICVRGKDAPKEVASGTFQWSNAVKAVCQLAILHALDDELPRVCLRGDLGSLAVSLDYALSKQPLWILEMFGAGIDGRSVARKLFHRQNPERKRPGPVAISINTSLLLPSELSFWIDEKRIEDRALLREMAQTIGGQVDSLLSENAPSAPVVTFPQEGAPLGTNQIISPRQMFQARTRSRFAEELQLALSLTPIFSQQKLTDELKRLDEQLLLRSVQDSLFRALGEVDFQLKYGERQGLRISDKSIAELFTSDLPIRFGVTPSQLGTLAILLYLRDIRKLPIAIDYGFAHTSDVVDVMRLLPRTAPECCVITTASSLLLKAKVTRDYRPLMVMPAATHSVLARNRAKPSAVVDMKGDYLLLCEFPTTPNFWFETMKSRGVISRRKAKPHHLDPNECLRVLRNGVKDVYTVLWFPYNVFNEHHADCAPLLSSWGDNGISAIQNILYVHRSLSKKRRYLLDILIRDAWLRLVESEELRRRVIDLLANDDDYLRLLWRCSGLPMSAYGPSPMGAPPDSSEVRH